MKTLLAVIALASVATFSSGVMAAGDEEQIFNIQSITGFVQYTACCAETPTQDFFARRLAIVPLTAPAKNSKVTITDQGLPDEFTLKGIDISVISGSEVVENGAIKGVTETGQFVAPDHPEQITSQSFGDSNFGIWKTTTAARPLRLTPFDDTPLSATSYGAYAAGDPTTQIPKSGSATYVTAGPVFPPALSQSGGRGWIVGGSFPCLLFVELAATSTINVDFLARSVTASITFSHSSINTCQAIITSPIVMTGKGVLNKNGSYTLALTGPLPGLPAFANTLVGTASGMLYGPSAHETAGTLTVVAGSPGYIGAYVQASFGATR